MSDDHLQYLLTAYAFGDISAAGRLEVETHLGLCVDCRAELARLRGMIELTHEVLSAAPDAPYAFDQRRLARVLTARPVHPLRRSLFGGLAAASVLFLAYLIMTSTLGGTMLMSREKGRAFAPRPRTAASIDGFEYDGARKEGDWEGESSARPDAAPAEPGVTLGLVTQDHATLRGMPTSPPAPTGEADPAGASPPAPQPPQSQSTLTISGAGSGPRRAAGVGDFKIEESGATYGSVAGGGVAGGGASGGKAFQGYFNRNGAPPAAGRPSASEAPETVPKSPPADGAARRAREPMQNAPKERDEAEAGLRSSEKKKAGPEFAYDGRAKKEFAAAEKATEAFDDMVRDEPEERERRKSGRYAEGEYDRAQTADKDADGPANADKADRQREDWGRDAKEDLNKSDPAGPEGAGESAGMEKQLRAQQYYLRIDKNLARNMANQSPQGQELKIAPPVVGDEGLGQERFLERYGVNPFVDTSRDHFSTFAMDVDTAAYTRARALLRAGRLPEPKTVRVEEFINAVHPALPPAQGQEAFAFYAEGGPAPFGRNLELVKLTVKAREMRGEERTPAVLTFAIDTSGSMFLDGRLTLVQSALKSLVQQLHPADEVAIVAYGSQAYLALPHTLARERERIAAAIDGLQPQGNTNLGAGLALAYRVADEALRPRAAHRVVLCSDGVATEGARSAQELLEQIQVFARRGIYLSVVGVGRGRYDDALLEQLADKGNGQYAYVDSPEAAREVFSRNLPAAVQVLAQDAKIQVEFDPAVVAHYRLLGYENRDVRDEDFRNDQVDAGEVGPGTAVTALYEIQRQPAAHGSLGRCRVRFHNVAAGAVEELDFPIPPGALAPRLDQTSYAFRLTAAAAELAEILRESYWARDGSLAEVRAILAGLQPPAAHQAQWRELRELAARAQQLSIAQLKK